MVDFSSLKVDWQGQTSSFGPKKGAGGAKSKKT